MSNGNHIHSYNSREKFIPFFCFIYCRKADSDRMKHKAEEQSEVPKNKFRDERKKQSVTERQVTVQGIYLKRKLKFGQFNISFLCDPKVSRGIRFSSQLKDSKSS